MPSTPVGVEAPTLLVVDASVVVAIAASAATRTGGIAELLADAELHAPAILRAEVDSALRGLERGGRLTPEQASAARRHAHELPIELWPWTFCGERAWELRANATTYDAGYLALAELLGATVLTGDARLAASGVARCPITLVSL